MTKKKRQELEQFVAQLRDDAESCTRTADAIQAELDGNATAGREAERQIPRAELIKKLVGLKNIVGQVLGGLKRGHIKSKPIVKMDPEATEQSILSLEDDILEQLEKVGIKAQV